MMVKCRNCLLATVSAHHRKNNGVLEEEDVCGLDASPVDLDKDRKCVNFVPFPDRDARRIFR